jgi:2-C-methyl-D-erythritol 2,4-cyclodiphosphate synthase/2-C-methyl-D-erythritol 4-phosphate cytidylyltransferase
MSDIPCSSDKKTPRHWVIIPAAGTGSRMQSDRPKQYLDVGGQSILEHSITAFFERSEFTAICVGLKPADPYWPDSLSQLSRHTDRLQTFLGGQERNDTVLQGLLSIEKVAQADDWVWVHDAARPCLNESDIDRLFEALENNDSGAMLALPIVDTLKYSKCGEWIDKTIPRDKLWRAQTPQVLRFGDLKEGLESALAAGLTVTDDAAAMEYLGLKVKLVQGSPHNIKVTHADDLHTVRTYLREKQKANFGDMVRIGNGYDVHAFEAGDHIIVGGVKIAHSMGLKAHSDGDVLLHALCDAMLGALALGDIGKHFPDTDEKWKGADSRKLLRGVLDLVNAKGYRLGNADTTIVAQKPKMAPYIDAMCKIIAMDLQVDQSLVSVKATTSEKLGFTGREEGIASYASVLLVPLA